MEDGARPPVPLTILTGFLGAGKTTLLNRILNGDHGLRVAVLVNDFGAINIDSELVVGLEDDAISLANGCVCCTIRDDLVDTVLHTIDRPEAPEYILLEASGVADPSGIAMTFVDSELQERVRLDTITCVVDAEQIFAFPDYPAVEQLRLRQIGFADMVVLNKIDLAGPEQTAKARAWVDGSFRRVRVIETSQCDVPLEILLSVGRFDATRLEHDGCTDPAHDHAQDRAHDHADTFSTWSYETSEPVSLDALREVLKVLPGSVYRAKGVIHSIDEPDRRSVLQVVGRRVALTIDEPWDDRERRTRIVLIGAPGSIDATEIEAALASCSPKFELA